MDFFVLNIRDVRASSIVYLESGVEYAVTIQVL